MIFMCVFVFSIVVGVGYHLVFFSSGLRLRHSLLRVLASPKTIKWAQFTSFAVGDDFEIDVVPIALKCHGYQCVLDIRIWDRIKQQLTDALCNKIPKHQDACLEIQSSDDESSNKQVVIANPVQYDLQALLKQCTRQNPQVYRNLIQSDPSSIIAAIDLRDNTIAALRCELKKAT
jgi:hypothetical protein